MNPQQEQTPTDPIAENFSEMQGLKALMIAEMGKDGYNRFMASYQALLKKVMGRKSLQAIEACDVIMDQLDANLALDEEERETQKAIFLIAACDLMGPDFINSLTQ